MNEPIGICAFCGNASDRMVEGPGANACGECLLKAREIIARTQQHQAYECRFCGETVRADSVVEGPNDLHMCIACIESGLKLLNR